MKIEDTQQPSYGPPNKPLIGNPVKVTLDLPIFYATERGPVAWPHSILCGQAFAETVLTDCERILKNYNYALVHLGIYNPRYARRKNGTDIKPLRWSNHAYGEAMDFKGIIADSGEGDFLDIESMMSKCPDRLDEIIDACLKAINAIGREPEIVNEDSWYHIGLWPK